MFCRTPRGKSEARKATYVPTPVRQCESPAGQALSLLSLLQAELKLVEAEARTSCILLRETEMLRVRAWAGSRAHRMFPMQAEGRTTRCGSIRLFCATQEALQSSEAKAASAQVTLQAATLSAECGAAALIGTDRVFCEGGGLRVGTESWAVRAQRTVCERQRKPSRAQHCQTPRTASAMALVLRLQRMHAR
jgi:hypothetical protein